MSEIVLKSISPASTLQCRTCGIKSTVLILCSNHSLCSISLHLWVCQCTNSHITIRNLRRKTCRPSWSITVLADRMWYLCSCSMQTSLLYMWLQWLHAQVFQECLLMHQYKFSVMLHEVLLFCSTRLKGLLWSAEASSDFPFTRLFNPSTLIKSLIRSFDKARNQFVS